MDKSKLVLPLSLLVFLVVLIFLPLGFKGLGFFITVAIIETITLYLTGKKKSLIYLVPMLLISGSTVVYDNEVWLKTNILIIVILYIMQIFTARNDLNIKNTLFGFIFNPLKNALVSFDNLVKFPKSIGSYIKDDAKKARVKKIIIALIVTIPIILIILFLLIRADQIFSNLIKNIFDNFFIDLEFEAFLRLWLGIIITLVFFMLGFSIFKNRDKEGKILSDNRPKIDNLVLNIILISVNIVYLIFIVIQFRYLFAGSTLPYNLNYAEYARRGFFELLTLTAVNLVIILISKIKGKELHKFTHILLYLLCTVTVVLMVSSFYRMYLYSADFGLTRLRLYVFIFLAFELLGLIATYFYIAGRKFNIIFTYFILGISYYTLLVVTPTDLIIARSQIKRYERDKTTDISYITELSLDALPEIEKLEFAEEYYVKIQQYYLNHHERLSNAKWNEYNVANDNFKNYKNK